VREGGYQSFALIGRRETYMETTRTLGAPLERELYDLTDDAAEHRNRWNDARADLVTALNKLREHARLHQFSSDAAEIDESTNERLKGLGYLN